MEKKSIASELAHYSSSTKVREVLRLIQKDSALTKDQEKYCDVGCVERYLRARGDNVKRAAKYLKASLAWRDTIVRFLTADEFSAEIATGAAFVAGHDDLGRPIVVVRMKPDFLLPKSQKRYIRFMIFTFEVAVSVMPEGVHQWVLIFDFTGSSKMASSPLSVVFTMLKIISDHYPERLAKSFFVDAPSMFYYLWKGMGPFVDHAIKEKISFSSSKDHVQPLPRYDFESLRHAAYPSAFGQDERSNVLSNISFLTPLSSPGGHSFLKRSLDPSSGAVLAPDHHRSLSFSSPANHLEDKNMDCRSFRADHGKIPAFGNSNSFKQSSRDGLGRVTYLFKKDERVKAKERDGGFQSYIKFCKAPYSEASYRAMLKPPLGGILSVIHGALNFSKTS